MAVDREPQLAIPFLPQVQFFFAHRIETIRGNPDLAVVSARDPWLQLRRYGHQLDQRLAVAGDQTSSPASARSTSRDSEVLAWCMLTISAIARLPS